MKYFDTDVIIHSIIIQEIDKHQKAIDLIRNSLEKNEFNISLLGLQETAFVLSKLGFGKTFIRKNIEKLLELNPLNYSFQNFKRATEIAFSIGFNNINDCLHTAIAEYYCNELLTYNKKDFTKIKKHTKIKITIL